MDSLFQGNDRKILKKITIFQKKNNKFSMQNYDISKEKKQLSIELFNFSWEI